MPEATAQPDTFWMHNRPIPLKENGRCAKRLIGATAESSGLNAIIKTAEILITGYIPTANDKKVTKFDFGPMNTTFSANHLEGFRMRVGGMTTANLSPYWFASGYLAYGTNDRKIKYNLKLTHSFTKKEYHEVKIRSITCRLSRNMMCTPQARISFSQARITFSLPGK